MTRTTTAVYETGVLRPITPLPLQEGETVQVTVTTPAPPGDAPRDDWKDTSDRLLAFARAGLFPPGFQADVSREGMYEGCGE